MPTIGLEKPHGVYRSAYYQGADELLFGKRAIIYFDGADVLAQFDPLNTEYSYGWHRFKRADFTWPSRADVKADLEACKDGYAEWAVIKIKYECTFARNRDDVFKELEGML